MEILSVSLTNFKAHSDRHFQFQPGTNAICGENGAGKTSILEAIAWVLFDHRGDYRLEDLIRNGNGQAQVRVVFISSRDQRTYEVFRCTKAGYAVYDPQAGQKLALNRIKEDVLPWLRQHLGVPPGTDLADLFASTIGVPQGTFAADFLLPKEKRKPIFDRVLKVEEYQKIWKDLLTLEKYAKGETERIERDIAQYQESLADWDALIAKRDTLSQEIATIQADLTHWETQLHTLQTQQQQVSAQAAQIQQLETQIDRAQTQLQAQLHTEEQLAEELRVAQTAVEICTVRREPFRLFQEAEQTLQQLEAQRTQQQQLFQQRQQLVQASSDRNAQLAALVSQLDRCQASAQHLRAIEPLIEQQTQLEQTQQDLRQQLQACKTWRQTQTREEKRLAQLTQRHQQLSHEIEQLQTLASIETTIAELEAQQERTQQQLSRIEAARQFEADLRQILTQAHTRGQVHSKTLQSVEVTLHDLLQAAPLWSESLEILRSALQEGVRCQDLLLSDLQEILEDLSEQLLADRLQQHLQALQQQLQTARQQQAQYLTLPAKQQQATTIAAEITEVRSHLEHIQTQLAEEPTLHAQLDQIQAQLTQLEDPRGRSRLLQRDLQQQATLEQQQTQLQASLAQTQAQIAAIDVSLEAYTDLETQIQQHQRLREEHRPDYELYLKNRELANSYRKRQEQVEAVQAQIDEIETQLADLNQQHASLTADFDPQAAIALQTAYQEAQTQQARLSAQLPVNARLLEEYTAQIAKLEVLQTKLQSAQTDLKQKQRSERFIRFARKAYKEAGPRITERYILSISREADKLFRELMNRPNVALEWTRDYEILVREGANVRRFVNLSGGEQMCAALAVRLALLKVLGEINIAFFDEPTTNMDRSRRLRLAEAIANIKTFRQLFVISHDDTFEQVTENVIVVERE